MSYVHALRCKECEAEYGIEPRTVCDADFGPVEVAYDYEAMKGKVTSTDFLKDSSHLVFSAASRRRCKATLS